MFGHEGAPIDGSFQSNFSFPLMSASFWERSGHFGWPTSGSLMSNLKNPLIFSIPDFTSPLGSFIFGTVGHVGLNLKNPLILSIPDCVSLPALSIDSETFFFTPSHVSDVFFLRSSHAFTAPFLTSWPIFLTDAPSFLPVAETLSQFLYKSTPAAVSPPTTAITGRIGAATAAIAGPAVVSAGISVADTNPDMDPSAVTRLPAPMIRLPITEITGPATAAIPASLMIICCCDGLSPSHAPFSSLAFWPSASMIGSPTVAAVLNRSDPTLLRVFIVVAIWSIGSCISANVLSTFPRLSSSDFPRSAKDSDP